jgi:hypothetical protein
MMLIDSKKALLVEKQAKTFVPAWIAQKDYLCQMLTPRRRSRLDLSTQRAILEHFVAGTPARSAAQA